MSFTVTVRASGLAVVERKLTDAEAYIERVARKEIERSQSYHWMHSGTFRWRYILDTVERAEEAHRARQRMRPRWRTECRSSA